MVVKPDGTGSFANDLTYRFASKFRGQGFGSRREMELEQREG